jgi:hypothetical protein
VVEQARKMQATALELQHMRQIAAAAEVSVQG